MKKKFLFGFCACCMVTGILVATGHSLNVFANSSKQEIQTFPVNDSMQTAGMVIKSINRDGSIMVSDGEDISYVNTENAKIRSVYGAVIDKITKDYIGSQVVITSPVSMSAIYPAVYEASELVVLPEGMSAVTGTVVKSRTGKSSFVKLKLGDGSYLVANTNSNTIVENQNGESLSLSSVKRNKKVTLYYSGDTTLSDPPQSYAEKIVIDTN